MIGVFPDPYPDELLYSVCARLQDRMQFTNKETVNVELFGARGISAAIDFPTHLEHLILRLPPSHSYSADGLINDLTLFPFYSPFIPEERVSLLREGMKGQNGAGIHFYAGTAVWKIRPPEWLRFCPLCVRDDKKYYGECYWHRLHQVPRIEVCIIHHIFLENSNVRARNRINKSEYISAEQTKLNASIRRLTLSLPDHQTLLRIAQDAGWLLAQRNLHSSFSSLRERYKAIFSGKSLLDSFGKIRVGELIKTVRSKCSHHLLKMLQCEFEGSRFPWPKQLVPHLNLNHTHHPIRHLLLIQVTGHTAESFFQLDIRSGSSKVSNSCSFGAGPWPCLNPACQFLGQLKITACQIKNRGQQGKQPVVGYFACICGYIYSRKGPDKSPEDSVRYDRVGIYGPVWEDALRDLWKDASVTVNQISRILKVTPYTVVYHAIQQELPFPRYGPGTSVCRLNTKFQKWIVQSQINKSEAVKSHILASKRELWLSIGKKHPEATREQLIRKVAPGLYKWLYVNDKEWLRAHMPPRVMVVVPPRRADWGKRDFDLSERIRQSVIRLRSIDPPERITKAAIARNLGGRIVDLGKSLLAKLPLTSKVLSEVLETRIEFAVRRVEWAADCFRKEDVTPTFDMLRRRTRFENSFCALPELKMVLELALRSLQQTEILGVVVAA